MLPGNFVGTDGLVFVFRLVQSVSIGYISTVYCKVFLNGIYVTRKCFKVIHFLHASRQKQM